MSSANDTDTYAQASGALTRTALVLIPGGVLALMSTTLVGVAVPAMVVEFASDIPSAQWVTTAYLLAAGIAIPVSGWASARFGVRRTWLTAMALFTLGSLLATIASGFPALSAARVVQGVGGGALEPVMLTALAQLAGPRRMGRVMGSAAAAMSIGPLAGPALGGLVVGTIGWRWTFGLTAIAAVAILVASVLLLRLRAHGAARLDAVGLILLGAATTAGLYGLSRAAGSTGFDALAIGALVFAAGAIVAFVTWARRRGERAIVDLRTFGHRGFASAVSIMALMGAAIYPLFFGLPLFYQGVAGLDPLAAGLVMIPYGVGTLIAMPIAGRLSDAVDPRVLIWTGSGIALAAFAGLLATGPETSLFVFGILSLVIGLGLGAIGSPTVSSLYRALPPALVPSGSTLLFIVNQLGGALGVAILVMLIGGSEWTAASGTIPLWLPVAAIIGIAALTFRVPRAR